MKIYTLGVGSTEYIIVAESIEKACKEFARYMGYKFYDIDDLQDDRVNICTNKSVSTAFYRELEIEEDVITEFDTN